jgi:hypothetical protein
MSIILITTPKNYCIIFHSILKVKFLAYVLNVIHHFVVMHIIAYINVVCLITYV